jgi:hypothetical protein
MKIDRSIDVEDEIRQALDDYIKTYARPLPANFEVPSILVTAVGGNTENTVDYFDVTLDSRATEDAAALENLRNAVGILVAIAKSQTTKLRFADINNIASWGKDPVRPELAMCTARLRVLAHIETVEVNTI